MLSWKCRFLASFLIPSFLFAAAGGAQSPPLVSGQLEVRGQRLTLYADAAGAGDAEQTINIGERATVRTCFGGSTVPCGSLEAGDPRIAGLRVEAELSGPELLQPLALTTVPGGAFVLPGFQLEGEYTLENIRLVNGESGQVISLAEPSLALLHVRRIVLASATVRALSLEELRARGIELTQENFQAFDFAVGFAIEGETVEIQFPVLFEGNGLAQALAKPVIRLDHPSAEVIQLVAAWKPPRIEPIVLETLPAGGGLAIGVEESEELRFPLFGAIVIPGTVTFLNQFFEAQLIVANGAPAGSQAHLGRLRALARLPGNRALRLAETVPAVVPGQWVPVVGADGSQRLSPGEQGSAAWVVEGLKPGTHSLILEIEGELERPGREPLPVRSLAQAAVEVVDARFQLTFSHPDVVRRDEEYTLFVTVTNQSQAAQNEVTVEIRAASMTGAAPADEDDPLRRTLATLRPGESATVEFRLVSLTTGKVIASTFQSESANHQGTIQLRAGVGELGIPLSPATLLMPRFTSELEARGPQLVRANVALLGLAYSLAVAPASLLPPDLASLQREDVERRAIDLAEAGERLYLGDGYLESLEALLLDQLGNRHPLANFDQLRRGVSKGRGAAEELAAELRREQQLGGLDAEELFDHLATTMSYARPFLAAVAIPEDGAPRPALEAIDRLGGAGLLAGSADQASTRRTLPFGEIYALLAEGGGGNGSGGDGEPRADLAVIGHLEGEAATTFLLRNDHGQSARTRLLLLAPDGEGGFRRLDYGVLTLAPGEILAIDAGAGEAGAGQGGFRPYDPATLEPRSAAPLESAVQLPSFRIVGARQDFYLDFSVDLTGNWHQPNRYGNGITYLFNRPPAAGLAEVPEAFRIATEFRGQAADDSPYAASNLKVGQAAFVQPNSERVAIVRYDGGVSPLLEGGAPLLEHHHQLVAGSIRDSFGQALAGPVPEPVLDSAPLHVGGLVGGQVKRGTGLAAPGVKVELLRHRWFEKGGEWVLFIDRAATTATDDDGRFFFDFVESPHHDRNIKRELFLRATVPAGADPLTEPAEIAEVSYSLRRQNKAMVVGIALLGRGGITGRLTYLDDGTPVSGGSVEAASTLFQEQQKVAVDAGGNFRFLGLPVGPISLAGSDAQGRRVYATVQIAAPGAVTDVALKIQRLGSVPPARGAVTGRVLFLRDGIPEEALGATVAVYTEGRFLASRQVGAGGRFSFPDVPAGRVSLQAADFRISRTAVYTDLLLGAEEVREVELRIPASSPKTVVGQVWQRDGSSGALAPLFGAKVLLVGPGNLAYTGEDGRFLLENVPVQGSQDDTYRLQIVNPAGTAQQQVGLPIILESSPDEVIAPTVIFEGSVRGTVHGRIYDPLGRPVPHAGVVLYPYAEGTAAADGSYRFENVPPGSYFVVASLGDGLRPGQVGYLGRSESVTIERNGADQVADVAMRGSGFVKIHTRTATSSGILTPIFYRPTYYSATAKDIVLRGAYTESSTDPNGDFEVELPLGDFVIVAMNPFHGQKEIRGRLTAAGEVAQYEIVFESLGKVGGTVVGNDGSTPVPFAEVVLSAHSLLPQTLQADEQGRFLFELVPAGPLTVTASAVAGNVERVGRTLSSLRAGEERELTVALLGQGSVTGRVMQENAPGQLSPVPSAQYYVRETSYPNRRLPAGDGNYYFTDADGRYEVPHLFAGEVSIVARDSGDISRQGSARAAIAVDWSVVTAPDIVFRGSDALGRITFRVRDPQTGAPVADAIVRLSTGEGSVTGSDGQAVFEALKVGSSASNPRNYSARAFYAPTGQAGQSAVVALYRAGQDEQIEIVLNQFGEVSGFLYEDATRTAPVAGATVRIEGSSVAGRVEGLATTSGEAGQLGSFVFSGIPEGSYAVTATSTETPRRAATQAALTATSPIVSLFLYLEPVGDRYFRVDQKLRAGNFPVDLATGIFAVKALQGDPHLPDYSFTSLLPEPASNVFLLRDLFLERKASIEARELGGELRLFGTSTPDFLLRNTLAGAGTFANPFRLLLPPKGVVTAVVRDADARPLAGVNVRLVAAGSSQTSATDAQGKATFVGVNAGAVAVSARSLDGVSSGSAQGSIVYDDDALELTIPFQPAVRATGKVYEPSPFDQAVIDPSVLAPAAAARVELVDSRGARHVSFTDAAGVYLFEGLPKGAYGISAASADGVQIAAGAGALLDPNGNLNALPALVLDGGPPAIVQMSPRSGDANVSTIGTTVEILFSEPLAPAYLPLGAASSYFFFRESSGGAAVPGNWLHFVESGRQLVRFVPSQPLRDFTLYSVTVLGSVADRAGRRLTTSGNVGFSFRTSDGNGPVVLSTEPALDRPVHPQASIRADFDERLVAVAEDLDGDGNADAALLEAQRLDGGWVALPSVYYLTRLDFSLQLDLPQGLEVPGDSLRRRLTLSRLRDQSGNPMAPWQREFRLYDSHAPTLAVAPPAAAPDGNLYHGNGYTLAPELGNLDELSPQNPGGDLDRVEYFFADPAVGTTAPGHVARVHPYTYSFQAAYAGSGGPRPFPIWVRAIDTSNNVSPVVLVDLRVLSNVPPQVTAVTASHPVNAQVFYPRQPIDATVAGISDADSNRLSLLVDLVRGDTSAVVRQLSRTLDRPAAGWPALAAPSVRFELPATDLPEGTPILLRATVVDAGGARATAEAAYAMADDDAPPVVAALQIRKGGVGGLLFTIGDLLQISFEATDGQTGLKAARVVFDRTDLFPNALSVISLNSGSPSLSSTFQVPAQISGPTEVVATVEVEDFGGNTRRAPLAFTIQPAADPFAPAARWQAPFAGALWPARYTSVIPGAGVPLLLRAAVADRSQGAGGEPEPGHIFSVEMRGPEVAPDGSIGLSATWLPAARISGDAAGGEYQLLWHVPNDLPPGTLLEFAVRAIDLGGAQTVETVQMGTVPARRVYQGVSTAILPDDPMLAFDAVDSQGPVFLLDGSVLSIYPQPGGALRSLPALFLYSGGFLSSGSLQQRTSKLVPVEINSLDSAILHYPLELAIETVLGVAGGTLIDGDGRGLLGGTASRPVALPGIAGPEIGEPGYHGGMVAGSDLSAAQLLRVYGDPRWPLLPGLGGRTGRTSADFRDGGGPGGAAIRIEAADAIVRIEGRLSARGLVLPRGASFGTQSFGGAGGAIALRAGLLEGGGAIDASAEPHATLRGGGGRVAILYGQLAADFDPARQARAEGGGTVYLEPAAGSGQESGVGVLRIASLAGTSGVTVVPGLGSGRVLAIDTAAARITLDIAATAGSVAGERLVLEQAGAALATFEIVAATQADTPQGSRVALEVEADEAGLTAAAQALAAAPVDFHGLLRYAALELAGNVKVLVRDDLALGPAGSPAPAVNDEAFVLREEPARYKLRGQDVAIAAVADLPEGEILAARRVGVSYVASDALGIAKIDEQWSSGSVISPSFPFGDTLVELGTAVTPFTAGPLSLNLRARSWDGSWAETTLRWTVLPNEAPAVTLTPEGASVRPGQSLRVLVAGHDREALSQLGLEADAPGTPAAQVFPLATAATDAEHVFVIAVPLAAGAGSLRLRATATDAHGIAATAEATVAIAAGGAPTASWQFYGEPNGIPAGQALDLGILAEDVDGNLQEARLVAVSGPIELPDAPGLPARGLSGFSDFWQIGGARVAFDAADGETIVLNAEVEDRQGNVFPLPPLILTTLGDHQPPSIDAFFPETLTVGNSLEGSVSVYDVALERVEILFDGATTTLAAAGSFAHFEYASAAVERPASGSLPLEIRAYDRLGQMSSLQLDIQLVADAPPQAFIEVGTDTYDPFLDGWVIVPGSQVTVLLTGQDDVGLASGELEVAGLVTGQESFVYGGAADSGSYTFTVPASAAVGDALFVSGAVTDSRGQSTAAMPLTVYVTQVGLRPPRARLYLDPEPAGGIYPALSTLQVVATGRKGDNTSAEVTIELAGRTETASGVVSGEWILPAVAEPTPLTVRVRAVGAQGLTEELERLIVVTPAGGPPAEVTFDCPGDGALLPAGAAFEVGLEARAASGIARLDLYANGELLEARALPGAPVAYQGSFALTLPAQPGGVSLRAVVVPAAGSPAEATSLVETVAATTLLDPQAALDGASLAGSTVALGAGTWTLEQPLSVANLILLPGARITHGARSAAPGAPRPKVDLAVAGRLYVACGAAIDVSGRGLDDSGSHLGGSHFGAGGLVAAGSGSSLFWPRKPGGGSGGSRGGGVAWIKAAELAVDGEIASDGDATAAETGGGAGGSLWIRVSGTIGGAGRISADGATAAGDHGSGGGGVVSLEYGSLASGLRGRISAKGGAGSHPGGAGGLVLKGPGELVGHLIVDGGAPVGTPGGVPVGAGSGPVIGLPRANPDLPSDSEGNFVTMFVNNDIDLEDYVGAVIDLGAWDSAVQTRTHDLLRVVDVRFAAEAECPEEDPYCGCADGGECPPESASAASRGLPWPKLLAPRATVSGYLRFELRKLDGSDADLGGLAPEDLAERGFFDRVTLRGQNAAAVGGLAAGLLEVDGVNTGFLAGYGSYGLEADNLLIRRGAQLAAPPDLTTGSGGLAFLVAHQDLILASGAAVDQTAAGRTVAQGLYPAGAGQSHIGTGGGITLASPEQLSYDNYADPVAAGRGFAGSPAGGGAVSIAADVVYLSPTAALLANGGPAVASGGSSGGALQLRARLLAGDGRIEARGGASATRHGGGGGGIRISWTETRGSWPQRTDACGGAGAAGREAGGAGSVYLVEENAQGGSSRLILDNCGLAGPLTYGIDPNFEANLSLRGGARIVWPAEIAGAGDLQLSGPVVLQSRRIEASSLTIDQGATLSAVPGQSLAILLAEDLVLAAGGRIDVSGAGFSASYPQVAGTAGNHVGYRGYSNPANRGITYGSLTRPGEAGSGTAGNPGGGVLEIEAANVRLDGAQTGISANGKGSAGAGAGGSIWIRTGHLGGDGFIEARGAAGGATGGGGGALALEFDSADGAVLARSGAAGGSGTLPGGAGSFFLFDRSSATHGVLRLQNDGRPGATGLPSLGSGAAASGTAGNELATSLAAIPAFFAGHWVEVRSSAGALKGQWRIESVSGNRLRLLANGGETIALEPGDAWTGFYLFDRLERDVLVSFESIDPLRAPITGIGGDGLTGGGEALEALTPDLGGPAGETAAVLPVDASRVLVEAAEIAGLYRVTVPASIFPAPRSFASISLGNPARRATAAWDPVRGASFLWAGEPGETLQLQAYDPLRPAQPLSIELPPLAAGAGSRGFGSSLDAEESPLDLVSSERMAWLLLARGELLELLEIDLAAETFRSLGVLPRLHAEHRLVLRDGAPGVAARGGEDGLPDAFFRLGPAGFEPLAAGPPRTDK